MHIIELSNLLGLTQILLQELEKKKRFLLFDESFLINQVVESTFQLKNGLVTYVFQSGIRALPLVVSCIVSHVIFHIRFVIDACLFNLMSS